MTCTKNMAKKKKSKAQIALEKLRKYIIKKYGEIK